MDEKITIQGKSDLITAKSGRKYFTLTNDTEKKYVCFHPALHEFCPLGTTIEADITPGKTAEASPRLEMVYDKQGKPVIEVEKKTPGRSFGKSDKELAQIKMLEEAKQKSIQTQVALKSAVDLAIADLIKVEEIAKFTKEMYINLHSLNLISEAEVIHQNIKETKSEVKKTQTIPKGQPAPQDPVDDVALDNEGEPYTVGGFLAWLTSHGKEYNRAWLKRKFNIPDGEILTIQRATDFYNALKESEQW